MKRIAIGLSISLVLVLIGAVALAWARPELVPAWARLGPDDAGQVAVEDYGLYCKEHGAPEKFCTLCHEELKTSLLLCKEHGDIPEDICTLCHPEVEAKYDLVMCREHGLPEHFCYLCGNGPSAAAAVPDDGWCAAHNAPEILCADCVEETPASGVAASRVCHDPLPEVRLAYAGLAQRIGLETAEVVEERHAHHVSANAETAFDANRHAEVYPRVDGYLSEVRVDLGQTVEAGEVIAVVDSAAVSAAKSRYIATRAAAELARATHARTEQLTRSRALPAKDALETLTALNQAEAAALDAEQVLRNLGVDAATLDRIAAERDTGSLLEIAAPISGTVVARQAVRGEAVQPTTPLFSIADTSRMWLWIDVYERDIATVAAGQPVRFTVTGMDLRADAPVYEGTVTWVGAEVDPRTRTTRVRAELANADGRLRANQFGRASIRVEPEHEALVIPREALQRKDGADLVFLPVEPGRYRPQRIVTRPTGDPHRIEVAWGLEPGQAVVTAGAFLLKTEIMRGAIGAGCCE